MGESADTYLGAIDAEVTTLKGSVTYLRASLLVTLTALSSLFWSISDTIGKNRFEISILVDIAPFIVATIFFLLCGIFTESVYAWKAKPPATPQDSPDTIKELLPHDLVLGAVFIIGAIMSVVTLIDHGSMELSLSSVMSCILFFISLWILVTLGISVIVPGRAQRRMKVSVKKAMARLYRISEEVSTSLSSPSLNQLFKSALDKVMKEEMRSYNWRSSFRVAVVMGLVGVACLLLGWHFIEGRVAVVSIAVQFTVAATLLVYALERLQMIHERLASIDAFEKERRVVIAELLQSSPYGQRYEKLRTEETYENLGI